MTAISSVTPPFKQKEAGPLEFLYVDENGNPVDVSTGTFNLLVKENKNKTDSQAIITKTDGDLDKTQAANGIIIATILEADTDQLAKKWVGEMRAVFGPDDIEKSDDLVFEIVAAVHKDDAP